MNDKPSLLKPPSAAPAESVKSCHRIYGSCEVPQLNLLNPQQVIGIEVKVAQVQCSKAKCSMWDSSLNEGKGECLEVAAARAHAKIPAILKQLDGLIRIGQEQG